MVVTTVAVAVTIVTDSINNNVSSHGDSTSKPSKKVYLHIITKLPTLRPINDYTELQPHSPFRTEATSVAPTIGGHLSRLDLINSERKKTERIIPV